MRRDGFFFSLADRLMLAASVFYFYSSLKIRRFATSNIWFSTITTKELATFFFLVFANGGRAFLNKSFTIIVQTNTSFSSFGTDTWAFSTEKLLKVYNVSVNLATHWIHRYLFSFPFSFNLFIYINTI